jgi:arylsulfatase A-like enzyme
VSRARLLFACGLVVAAVVGVALGLRPATRKGPPNVVFVLTCTTRRDQLTPYGGPKETTPFLDRLAAAGARFDDVIAGSSWTKESSTAIFAGIPALDSGMADFGPGLGRRRLPDDLTTLAEHLAAAGWWTAGVTANPHLDAQFGFAQGMAVYEGTVEDGFRRKNKRSAADVVADALRLVAGRSAEERARPAYLQITTIDPHYPIQATADELARFADPTVPSQVIPYRAMLRRLDDALAALERGLDAQGIHPDDTLWVVVADHGEGLSFPQHHRAQHGSVLYESLVRVGWMMRGPGVAPRSRIAGLAAHLDVSPTVRGVLGLPVAPPSDPLVSGYDWSPLLRAGGGETSRDRAIAATWYLGGARGSIWTDTAECQADWGSKGIENDTFATACFDRVADPTFTAAIVDAPLAAELDAWRLSALDRRTARGGAAPEAPRDDPTREQLEALGYAE